MELTMMSRTPDIHLVANTDLDLSDCVVGPDLIARFAGDNVTIYRRYGRTAELLGCFDSPAEAFAALDRIDAPAPLAGERPGASGRLAA
jgi:hypothetical protein